MEPTEELADVIARIKTAVDGITTDLAACPAGAPDADLLDRLHDVRGRVEHAHARLRFTLALPVVMREPPPMYGNEFRQLAPIFVERFMPRIPEQYRKGFDYELGGGEYSMAIENLVTLIHRANLPLYGAEPRQLWRMLEYLGAHPDGLARFEVTHELLELEE